MDSKIIQIESREKHLLALCEDGTLWFLREENFGDVMSFKPMKFVDSKEMDAIRLKENPEFVWTKAAIIAEPIAEPIADSIKP